MFNAIAPMLVGLDYHGLIIEWKSPVTPVGAHIIGYNVYFKVNDETMWHQLNLEIITQTEFVFQDYNINHVYEFKIEAIDDSGNHTERIIKHPV